MSRAAWPASRPVAAVDHAANGLSRVSTMDSCRAARTRGLTGCILPFMFVFTPALRLIGEPTTVPLAAVAAAIGLSCAVGGLHQHFLVGITRPWERGVLIAAALMIQPGWVNDRVGVVLIALTPASRRWVRRAATTGVPA